MTQFSILATIARLGEANLRQLEYMLAIDQTTLTRSLNLLERDGAIERASHPDARITAMKLTSKGRRALEAARPLWARARTNMARRAVLAAGYPERAPAITVDRQCGAAQQAIHFAAQGVLASAQVQVCGIEVQIEGRAITRN